MSGGAFCRFFFISFEVFPDWVNKFRTLRENIFGSIFKFEFCVCRETVWVSKKNVNVITRSGQNPENKVYILGQWFLFPNLLPRKICSLPLLVFFLRTCLPRASSSIISPLPSLYYLHFLALLGDRFANGEKKKREVHITDLRLVRTNKSMRPY